MWDNFMCFFNTLIDAYDRKCQQPDRVKKPSALIPFD